MSETSLIANWNYPTRIRIGAGRISELAQACIDMGIKAPLFVTDPGLAATLMVGRIIQDLRASGLDVGLFCQIKANPTGENVLLGTQAYQIGQHDGVIAFGGGSALDAAKAIALMVGQERPLWDFEDIGDNWSRVNVAAMAPVIAVPTTAGTGSEVGRASVITDTEEEIKKIIFHPNMLPGLVILDPELTVGLPPALTAATGMDALSHCLEAFCATYYHPMAEGIAMEGIRLIKENLVRAYQQGNDTTARCNMLVASAMGATAFQRGLGAMHALAHPLGALFDAHHGRLNAVLMPYVLEANRSAIEEKIKRLSNFLSISNGFDGFLDWIMQMRLELKIENTLSELGIDHKQVDRLAKMATEDAAAGSNPIPFSQAEYKVILVKAIGK
ncbi:iron-containing alcohol dehydrogenase [Legionella waltersii]|uniref:Alcohol dehydrogenase n=1 Tax=Legionella waltersii TaxID=66969 RepID=A0A0W1A017_9GAMM|nr:iron-containing alcohol dehydrogenase [Legionella waltersii]KTD74680.1 alcohol dehydrogenase [Legionella waltersii]SNV09191.1 alcohol dehydrogenase [Legionella waltersii]